MGAHLGEGGLKSSPAAMDPEVKALSVHVSGCGLCVGGRTTERQRGRSSSWIPQGTLECKLSTLQPAGVLWDLP